MTATTNGKFCQQDEIYEAEFEARASRKISLGTTQDVRFYLRDEIMTTPWWSELVAPHLPDIEVYRTQGTHSFAGVSHGKIGQVHLLQQQHTLEVLLHEVTHCVAEAVHGSRSHDPWYARIHLEIVCLVRGSKEYVRLADAYARHGVQVADRGIVWQRKGLIVG